LTCCRAHPAEPAVFYGRSFQRINRPSRYRQAAGTTTRPVAAAAWTGRPGPTPL